MLSAEVFFIPDNSSFKLDGLMDESFWDKTIPIGPLTMVEPQEGVSPSERTEVRVAASSDAIYFGITCYDSRPDKIVSYTMQRDARLRGEDHIKVVLDTFLNGRTGYIFAVNPNGARYDALIEREGEGENQQWDGIWEAAARLFEQGWSAEIYIPAKTLRFGTGLTQWGFNVERRIERLLETDRWASPNRNYRVSHISQGGRLTALPAFKQGMGLTVRPYVLASRSHDNSESSIKRNFEPGLDVMKNFGGNVTGLLSINTDFAETEVDTRRVNLTRFPLFFPEKRTFFLEGSDIFNFGLGMGFHHSRDIVPFFSRRIGLIEGHAVPLDLSVKATGSLGRFNFGVLDTVTRPVDGLAPRTNLFAARGFQNLWAESKLGFIVTAGDPLGGEQSWMTGLDFVYKTSRFQGDKNFLIGVWGLVNNREGSGSDCSAFGFEIDFPNDLWDIALTGKRIGEDFDPAMGFVPWKGIYKYNINIAYRPRPKLSWLRQIWYELFASMVTDLDGQPFQWRIFTAPINWHFESGDRVEFNLVPQMERLPYSFELSPGVSVDEGKYQWMRYRLEYSSASKRRIRTKLTWWFGSFYDGHMNQCQGELAWRPSHRINLALEGEWNFGSVPSGDVDIRLVQSRINLFFSPNFQILSFFQYDNLTKSLGMNTRLRWTYRSLLDVFLVYNRNWLDTERTLLPQLNQFFIKIQYSWRM
ncbi:MAG: hypothetical protein GF421_05870 [Candidatus Aminicenantes bacterium]|nr:hypothetical protein [Candidatus Aminicenantes bacterium]